MLQHHNFSIIVAIAIFIVFVIKCKKLDPAQLEERGHSLVPAEPGLASARPAYCQVGHPPFKIILPDLIP